MSQDQFNTLVGMLSQLSKTMVQLNAGLRTELRAEMQAGFAESLRRDEELRADMEAGFAESIKRDEGLRKDMETGFAQSLRRDNQLRSEMETGFAESKERDNALLNDLGEAIIELEKDHKKTKRNHSRRITLLENQFS